MILAFRYIHIYLECLLAFYILWRPSASRLLAITPCDVSDWSMPLVEWIKAAVEAPAGAAS